VRDLNLKVAQELPPSDVVNNAFSNSYHYSAVNNTLSIHSSRLSSSGDFGLIIIHALSHIKVDYENLSDDSNPRFVAEFYKNLKILSQDLYRRSAPTLAPGASAAAAAVKASARRRGSYTAGDGPSSSVDTEGPAIAGAPPPLLSRASGKNAGQNRSMKMLSRQTSIKNTTVPGDDGGRATPVTRESFGLPVAGEVPSDDYFSTESLHERLRQYATQGGLSADVFDKYAEKFRSRSNNENTL
jgi:hypothetical protein